MDRRIPLRALALCGIAIPAGAQSSIVYVQAGPDVGQGYAVARSGECFVLTPAHVVQSGADIQVLGEARRQRAATHMIALPRDIAVLRVPQDAGLCPPAAPPGASAIRQALERSAQGTLRTRAEDGRIRVLQVQLRELGDEFVTVRPERADDVLKQGLSGSLLAIGDQPVALLLSVDAKRGEGRAIRLDRVHALAAPLQLPVVSFAESPPVGRPKWIVPAAVGGAVALGGLAYVLLASDPEIQGTVTFESARFASETIECPDGSTAVLLPYQVLVEADNTTAAAVAIVSYSVSLRITASPQTPSEVGRPASSTAFPSSLSSNSLAPRSRTSLIVSANLQCNNALNDTFRTNEWEGTLTIAAGNGSQRALPLLNRMTVILR